MKPLYAQLIRLHERLLDQLIKVRDELGVPSTRWLTREIRDQVGESATEGINDVTNSLEEAIRAVKASESQARSALLGSRPLSAPEDLPDLPRALIRFIVDRLKIPGFTYRIERDEIRGWTIRWKERSQDGTVRGSGRYYERPYALLDDI